MIMTVREIQFHGQQALLCEDTQFLAFLPPNVDRFEDEDLGLTAINDKGSGSPWKPTWIPVPKGAAFTPLDTVVDPALAADAFPSVEDCISLIAIKSDTDNALVWAQLEEEAQEWHLPFSEVVRRKYITFVFK